MNLLCYLGFHKWEYINYSLERLCKRCSKKQYKHVNITYPYVIDQSIMRIEIEWLSYERIRETEEDNIKREIEHRI